MKYTKLVVGLATVALLASCGPVNTSTENSSQDVSTSEVGPNTSTSEGSTDSSTSELDKETYSIKITGDTAGVNLTLDKQRASLGDVVNITVTVTDPSYRVSKVLYDGLECTKLADDKYCFIMPDHPVKVTCLTILEGDVTLQGDITAAFKKEGDIYVARGVKVSQDSNFDVVIKDKDGNSQKLGVSDVDRFQTFANIGFAPNSALQNLTISGRATYDFYYDVNNGDKPLYVKRTSIDELPSNARGVYDLFDGRIRSASSVNPDNVTSMTFTNVLANETVTWKAYDDGTTHGVVTQKDVESKDIVKGVYYTSLKDGNLKVIDTFVPGANEGYNNNSFSSDITPFSGEYKVSETNLNGSKTENNEFEYKHPFVNESVAKSMINEPLITMEDFENEFNKGYRVGYTVGDAVTQATTIVTSSVNEDGGFTTLVKGSTTYDSSKDRTHSGQAIYNHSEYRTTLTFTKAGALLNGEFLHKSFGQDTFNFNSNTFISGDADSNFASKGKLENKVTIAYTYGDRFTNDANFDTTPYFVSKIKDIVIDNPEVIGNAVNQLNVGDSANAYVSAGYEPATALNAYQYEIIASSNEAVIQPVEYKGYIAKSAGTSDLTIGIVNGLGVTGSATVTVVAGQLVRSFFMNARWGKFQEITTSDSANVYTGQENEFGLDCKSGKNKDMPIPLDVTLEIEGDAKGFTARIDHEKQSIIIDGSGATFTESTSFKVIIHTPSYDPSWDSCHPSTLTFTILKGIANDALIGTWTSEVPGLEGASITFTFDKTGDEKYPFKGSIISSEGTFEFNYYYNSKRNEIKCKLVGDELGLSDLEFIYHSDTHNLDAFFIINDWSVEDGQTVKEVFGWEDGESKAYEVFTKAN